MSFGAWSLRDLLRHATALPVAVVLSATLTALLAAGVLSLAVLPRLPLHGAGPHAVRHAPPGHLALRHPPATKPIPKPQAKPAAPSAFALEQAMGYRELLDRWTPLIQEAARRYKISPQWIRAVIVLESGGRTMLAENRPIVSIAGAMGLMQLMPETYREMRIANRLGADPFDPHDNIMAGTAYLHLLYGQYGYPTMFAAYNDGPGMLEAHRALSQPVPEETANYVRDIASILSTGVRHRAGGKAALARLTRPDGTAVLIDAGAVVSIRAALPGEYAPGVQSVIAVGRLRQGVREDARAATAIVRGHGGLI
ncbi:MAG: transglycosylase SLT domain-containing protein [Rhizomicrobium sp.]